MIYTSTHFLPDTCLPLIQKEVCSFFENLPQKEKNRHEEFIKNDSTSMYFVRLHSKDPASKNIECNIIFDPEISCQDDACRQAYASLDQNIYAYDNTLYFPNTIKLANSIECITNTTLLYIKPNSHIPCHVHDEAEMHTFMLVNDVENGGHLQVQCNNHEYRASKLSQFFSLDGRLPHSAKCTGGHVCLIVFAARIDLLNNRIN